MPYVQRYTPNAAPRPHEVPAILPPALAIRLYVHHCTPSAALQPHGVSAFLPPPLADAAIGPAGGSLLWVLAYFYLSANFDVRKTDLRKILPLVSQEANCFSQTQFEFPKRNVPIQTRFCLWYPGKQKPKSKLRPELNSQNGLVKKNKYT